MRDTIEMAREAGFDTHTSEVAMKVFLTEELKAFEALVRADEREACARVCEAREEQWHKAGFFKDVHEFREMAFAIRSRGEVK
jgi:hypothetical protein